MAEEKGGAVRSHAAENRHRQGGFPTGGSTVQKGTLNRAGGKNHPAVVQARRLRLLTTAAFQPIHFRTASL
jgi:hypothetical protein